MGHPIMFDAEDPLLARLRQVCLTLPDAAEKVSHGRPNWFTTKVFAVFGGSIKGDHSDPLLARALLFLPDPEERTALEQDARFHVPAYYGPAGWLALPLDGGGGEPDWDEVAELVESSYRQTAGVRRVARLDDQRRSRG
ncbi:MmcQ/YjbR family DNA-binding protein [Dietzia cinnamea]|uniref:MmcQ/YjbR family DNA-binding protein n=1 Tax=Dietzia cinnamea TaxID=321318 RepID=UPI0021A9247A|nr:MmcQ/YjbR family DNA-binding protein [Dietzia cinnamea]MCT1710526.1 MmcQ/YjbR family DNA-binding protein [Dietzia cinnamea]